MLDSAQITEKRDEALAVNHFWKQRHHITGECPVTYGGRVHMLFEKNGPKCNVFTKKTTPGS